MLGQVSGGSRYRSLRHSQRVLERMGPLVQYGLFAVGVSVALDRLGPLISDAQFTWGERRVMGIVALVTLVGFGVAGWVVGRLIRTSADLIELHVVPALGRIAAALERDRPAPPPPVAPVGPQRPH